MSNPLTPLSANSHKVPTTSTSLSKPMSPRATSPSRLPQKTPVSYCSPSKPIQANTAAPAPSSPFMSFSPVVQSARASKAHSPIKANSLTKLSFDDEFDPFNDGGDGNESVCSKFSDVTAGAYNTASQGCDKIFQESASSARKSPVKFRPQTPRRSPTKTSAETPRTAWPTARAQHEPTSPASSGLLSSPHTPIATSNHTVNLLDFTQQFEAITQQNRRTPVHRRTRSASPRKGSPSKIALPPSTPTESRFFNLLDFSPGPTSTPRSIPSITPREVEELKAGFSSQISLLNAQLSGREVEVTGLRTAVKETETRCADLSNALKDQKSRSEDERDEWQKIKAELKELFETEKSEKESITTILAEKEQVVDNLHSELENKSVEVKNLKKRLRDTEDDLERTREEVLRARKEVNTPATSAASTSSTDDETNKARTQEEVERVARELHSLYKAKHETKVAALKKSYEGRWGKKVTTLEERVAELTKKNQELVRDLAEKKAEELTADMSFTPVLGADEDLRRELQRLQKELQNEKQEKKDIVALVEELLAIENQAPETVEEKKRDSVRRASGMGLVARTGGLRSGIERMGKGSKKPALPVEKE